MIILALYLVTTLIQQCIMIHDSFAKFGLWFSKDGWKIKYILAEWLNKYLPLWLSKFLAYDVLVVFTDLFHFIQLVFVSSLCIFIFGLSWVALIAYFTFSILFSILYYSIR